MARVADEREGAIPTFPPPREGLLTAPPLRLLPRSPLREGALTELRLLLGEPLIELRLLLRDGVLIELRLLLDERLLLIELLWLPPLRLLLIELLWLLPPPRLLLIELLWLLPPPRLPPPPPRCANAGVALSARAIITRVIAFEVFMLLLLSCLVSFSGAKILPFPEGNS